MSLIAKCNFDNYHLQKKAQVLPIHGDELKTDQTWTPLQAAPFHIQWHDWWILTLMFVQTSSPPSCPRVALQLKSSCPATMMRNSQPSALSDHLGISCYFAILFHVSVSVWAARLSAWVTAEWQVPSENMAHHVNARQALWAEKRLQLPVTLLDLISHCEGRREGPELPEKPVRWHLFFLSHRGWMLTDWMTDWGRKICLTPGWHSTDG